MLCACRSQPKPIVSTRESIRIERVKDTLSVQALLECDSLNNVLMKSLAIAHTPNILPSVNLKDNRLTIDAVNIRDSIRIIERDSLVLVPYSNPPPEKSSYAVCLCVVLVIAFLIYIFRKRFLSSS